MHRFRRLLAAATTCREGPELALFPNLQLHANLLCVLGAIVAQGIQASSF